MSNPLHAKYYADAATQHTAPVVENVRIARDTYRLRLACPEIASRITPGQFLMFRLAGFDDPLLGRPLAMYDTFANDDGSPAGVDVVYLTLGKMTRRLAAYRAGQVIDFWGPLGNGFSPVEASHLVMVAGGIGQTPFLALGQQVLRRKQYGAMPWPTVDRVTFCYGARTADYLAGVDDFRRQGIEVRISTDDGSAGRHGLVTDVLRDVLDEFPGPQTAIACCGPEPMMAAVSRVAAERELRCWVSLETPMACGIGICFSCVARVRDDQGEWDYKRTCVEGPIFEAKQIDW